MPLSREKGYTIPQMFDAAVAGDLKAMYIFGEDVAQTDPNTAHVVHGARVARVPRLPGHLRDRDDEVRRRDPARLVVPREGGHVHQRRAAHPARRAGDRAARRGARPTSRSSRRSRARSATSMGCDDARGRDATRSRALTPRLRRRHLRAARPQRACSGRSRPTAPTRRSSTSERVRRCPAARRSFAALPYKAPGDAADDEFPLILVTGRRLQHYNAGTMTRRTGNLELIDRDVARDPPRRRRAAVDRRRRPRLGAQPRRADRDRRRRSPTGSSPATSSRRSTSRRCGRTC